MNKIIQNASSFVDDSMITIALEDGGKFTVQKALLSNLSPHFKAALENFQESETKTLKLPDATTEDVQLLLYWAQHKDFPGFGGEFWDMEESDFASEADFMKAKAALIEKTQLMLVHLWILADKWLMPALQNTAMRFLLNFFHEVDAPANPAAARLAWEWTLPGSPLRNVFVHRVVDTLSETLRPLGQDFGYTPAIVDEFAALPGFLYAFAAIDEEDVDMHDDASIQKYYLVSEIGKTGNS